MTSFGDGFYAYIVDSNHKSYFEVISSSNSKFWKETIEIELDSISKN